MGWWARIEEDDCPLLFDENSAFNCVEPHSGLVENGLLGLQKRRTCGIQLMFPLMKMETANNGDTGRLLTLVISPGLWHFRLDTHDTVCPDTIFEKRYQILLFGVFCCL